MIEGTDVSLEEHRRSELDAANSAERRQESFHLPVRFREVVHRLERPIVQFADWTKHRARGESSSSGVSDFDASLLLPLNDPHASKRSLMTSGDSTHRRVVTSGVKVQRVFLKSNASMSAMRAI